MRAVANRVIDIRDGKMTVIDGDYDYYLFKREDLAAREAAAGAEESARSTRPATGTFEPKAPRTHRNTSDSSVPVPSGKKTKEQRRAEAEARAELNKRLKSTRDRLKRPSSATLSASVRAMTSLWSLWQVRSSMQTKRDSTRRLGNITG